MQGTCHQRSVSTGGREAELRKMVTESGGDNVTLVKKKNFPRKMSGRYEIKYGKVDTAQAYSQC